MNTLTLKDYPSFRQWIQVVGAAVLAALVSYNYVDGAVAEQILLFVTAVLPPALSALNSADGLRTWLYGVIAAAQTAILTLNITDVAHLDPIVNIILAAVGGSVAVTHTPTPLAAGRHAQP